jgi:uncharacterized protein (TIGR03790 family)
MTVSKENVLFIYRDGDIDSLSLAQYYKQVYDLDDDQIYPIVCSDIEILPDYKTFYTEVELGIQTVLNFTSRSIFVIILGYNVPGGFYDGIDIISSTSRISRINHRYNRYELNVLYDRKTFKWFDEDDTQYALICSRIDAPTLDLAKSMINNGVAFQKQHFANGKLYFDPYFEMSSGKNSYRSDLFEFMSTTMNDLHMEVVSTSGNDPYIDIVFPYLIHDSFYWGWFQDRSTMSFFKETDAYRLFFYNADYDSAYTIKDIDAKTWSVLALRSGYISIAGAMSNPSEAGFLRPIPFFDTLLYGGTLGEAYLFSSPYLNWTMTMFGDPLIRIFFNANDRITFQTDPYTGNEIQIVDKEDENELWRQTSKNLSRSIASYYKKELEANDILNTVVMSTDVNTEINLLYPAYDVYNKIDENYRKSIFGTSIQQLFLIIPERFNTDSYQTYLSQKKYKVSQLLLDTSLVNLNVLNNIWDEGYWEIEFTLSNAVPFSVKYYHFNLEVSDESNFSTIIYNISSKNNIKNWEYERNLNSFIKMDSDGVRSNYTGRRIRYKSLSSQYLNRGYNYYFRYRQLSSTHNYLWRNTQDVIFT